MLEIQVHAASSRDPEGARDFTDRLQPSKCVVVIEINDGELGG
jgi:hypothetical protein